MQLQQTVKQHYVPQVYLRGFSEDKKRVYSFNLRSKKQNKQPVPIKSVCRKNHLYEIKRDAQIIFENYIEHILSAFEGEFAKHFRTLEEKSQDDKNYRTGSLFSNEEEAFWKGYTAIQLMRSPHTLKAAEIAIVECFGDSINDDKKRNTAISQCLPFFKELQPNDLNAFSSFLRPIDKMSIAIGVDRTGSLFTSDNPVYCYAPCYDKGEIENIVFPLSSNFALLLFGGEEKKEYDNNRLFLLDQGGIERIKKSVIYVAKDWLFSKSLLSENDFQLIETVLQDKKADMEANSL